MNNLTFKIKQLAEKHGFDKVGITSAIQPEKSKLIETWLTNKYHGSMWWMAQWKEKRSDIQKFLPGARSVICVALNYFTNENHPDKKDIAKISRYAWGHDYHKIMKKKLKRLLSEIKEMESEIEGRVCVDTAPIMEKNWAEKAGIGWQGKHTNIITRNMGSWIFLGEMVLNKELDYDLPATDMCGSCSRCIQACPTDAIIAPYVLDAKRCISYLTIEYWDKPIPNSFKGKFKNYIFGCDICQEVCPWNKYQTETRELAFHSQNDNHKATYNDLFNLNEMSFKSRFKKSPVMRTGWENFVRNIEFVFKNKK